MGSLGFSADLNSLGSAAAAGRRDSLSDYTKNLIGQPRGGMGNYGNLNPLTGLTGGLAGTVSPPGIGNNANLLRLVSKPVYLGFYSSNFKIEHTKMKPRFCSITVRSFIEIDNFKN